MEVAVNVYLDSRRFFISAYLCNGMGVVLFRMLSTSARNVVMSPKPLVRAPAARYRWCHRAKEYLSRKGISYLEHDVSKDREKAKEMIEKSKQMGYRI